MHRSGGTCWALPLFAGAALAAETGNLSLADAAKHGDRDAVRSLLSGRAQGRRRRGRTARPR